MSIGDFFNHNRFKIVKRINSCLSWILFDFFKTIDLRNYELIFNFSLNILYSMLVSQWTQKVTFWPLNEIAKSVESGVFEFISELPVMMKNGSESSGSAVDLCFLPFLFFRLIFAILNFLALTAFEIFKSKANLSCGPKNAIFLSVWESSKRNESVLIVLSFSELRCSKSPWQVGTWHIVWI